MFKKKVCLILHAGNVGGGQTAVQRLLPLPQLPDNQEAKSFHRQREGTTYRNSTVSSDSHPEIGHRRSDHPGCCR